MAMIVVCGTPWCAIQEVSDHLTAAGVGCALNAPSGTIVELQTWHKRLLASQKTGTGPITPGKAWELTAAEVFLANCEQAAWHIADPSALRLLNFWRDFDEGTLFLLIHTPIEEIIARWIDAATPQTTPLDEVIAAWCHYQEVTLSFYLRNRQRTIFVQDGSLASGSTEWLDNLVRALGLPIPSSLQTPSKMSRGSGLSLLVARMHLAQHPHVLALQQEFYAAVEQVGDPEIADLEPQSAVADLQLLLNTRHKYQAISAEMALVEQQLAAANATLQTKTDEFASLQKTAQESTSAQAHEIAARDNAHKALQEENELLLLQLHQVQEELEQLFLKSKDTDAKLHSKQLEIAKLQQSQADLKADKDKLDKAHAELKAQCDAEAKANADPIAQRDALAKEKIALATSLASLKADKDKLDKAHAELKAQRDAEAKANADAIAQRDVLTKEKTALATSLATLKSDKDKLDKAHADLKAQRDAEAKADAIAQRDAFAKEKTALAASQVSLTQENELLLLQLHQVQEELENYFLQHQQASQALKQANARIEKLHARNPGSCEWERLEVLDAPAPDKKSKSRSLPVRLFGLQVGGREIPPLALTLQTTGVHRTLTLQPAAEGQTQPLLRWPATALEGGVRLPITLDAEAEPGSPQALTLASLAPSDLAIVRAACAALAEALPPTQAQRSSWVSHALALRDRLTSLPPVWRYDSVQLIHEQVNPDYEHLWLRVSNAAFADRQWARFEFRLSAAHVRKGQFSHQPKLEFPLAADGIKQFENWFEESEDDTGPKFELRFNTKSGALDVETWGTLSAVDQGQAASLIEQLPTMLEELIAQGAEISRPWAQWQTAAQGIRTVLQKYSLGAGAKALAS